MSQLNREELLKKYDAGHSAIAWADMPTRDQLVQIDLDLILKSGNPLEVVRSIPTQVLYHAIKAKGLAECADVISLLSSEQFCRMLDYDVWAGDELMPQQVMNWLQPLSEKGPATMAVFFKRLPEEYQLAVLDGMIRVFDSEQMESMSEEQKDDLHSLSLESAGFYYEITTDTSEMYQAVFELIKSAEAMDVKYAMSLLAHAAYLPPNESEHTLLQFRKARIEEDGFVDFAESLRYFDAVDLDWLIHKYSKNEQVSGLVSKKDSRAQSYLEAVVFAAMDRGEWSAEEGVNFQLSILTLTNALCSAAQIEASDLDSLSRVIDQSKSLLSLGLDFISGGDKEAALKVLRSEHIKTLFGAGLTQVYRVQKQVLDTVVRPRVADDKAEKFARLVAGNKWGAAQLFLDTEIGVDVLGLETLETLRGLFNRFPMRAVDAAEGRIKFVPIRCREDLQACIDRLANNKEWKQ